MNSKPQLILDIECYPNYFLATFYSPVTGMLAEFERTAQQPLAIESILFLLEKCEIVTFNGNNYDLPVLSEALRGRDCEAIRNVSDHIIVHDMKPYKIAKLFGPTVRVDHIDLIEVTFGKSSLKIYGGRLGCKSLQDLPYDSELHLTPEQMHEVKMYCRKDVTNTAMLLKAHEQQIELRRTMSVEYGVDLRSKSDAQIAEAVIGKEMERITGTYPKKPIVAISSFVYEPPSFLIGLPVEVREALQHPFEIKSTGGIEMPKELSTLKVKINQTSYKLGMGGLHSMEKCVHHQADENYLLADYDVTSYYPSIILNCELYPKHMGTDFLDVYEKLVKKRLDSKSRHAMLKKRLALLEKELTDAYPETSL